MGDRDRVEALEAIFLVRNFARRFGEPGAEPFLARLACRVKEHMFPVFETEFALAAGRGEIGGPTSEDREGPSPRRECECGQLALGKLDTCYDHRRSSSGANGKCPICFEAVGEAQVFTLTCAHSFHFACLRQLRNTRCPLCRREIENAPADFLAMLRARQDADAAERDYEEAASFGAGDGSLEGWLALAWPEDVGAGAGGVDVADRAAQMLRPSWFARERSGFVGSSPASTPLPFSPVLPRSLFGQPPWTWNIPSVAQEVGRAVRHAPRHRSPSAFTAAVAPSTASRPYQGLAASPILFHPSTELARALERSVAAARTRSDPIEEIDMEAVD
uniref:Putative RING finger E3 ubiquitin ligase n=1 Tax=Marseillevirus LCMAC103 TaxID=2506604 RepID=A0A481YVR4_9VIRU|nr:MAG: putative RING finger E3 ubiquitin ligase [Marseillevirus LCMAC103]